MRKRKLKILLCLWSLVLTTTSFADFSVIVHPGNTQSIGKDDVARLFLGKTTKFPDGQSATPVNRKQSVESRDTFDQSLLNKSPSQMKSYWAQLIFTGKAYPIKEVDSDAEILELVSGNPGAIGYVESSKVNNTVKVLFTY